MAENKLPTVDIKGKDYVLVKDRVLYFNQQYPNGSIRTERIREGEMEIIKAIIIPDVSNMERVFTGYSQATWGDGYINKTSALENCESSAVGRALAFMGIGVLETIASADEVKKAEITQKIQDKKEKVEVKSEGAVVIDKNTLPRFNAPELEMLKGNVDWVKSFDHSEKLIKSIETKYKVSKDMKVKIADLWAEL